MIGPRLSLSSKYVLFKLEKNVFGLAKNKEIIGLHLAALQFWP